MTYSSLYCLDRGKYGGKKRNTHQQIQKTQKTAHTSQKNHTTMEEEKRTEKEENDDSAV